MDILDVLKNVLEEKKEIVFAYLFGSIAKGTENSLSDVDVAVYLDVDKMPESGNFGYKSELVLSLEDVLSRKVDLVILSEAPVFLAYNILKNGLLIFSRSEKEKVDFHFRIVRNYLDFKPFINVQNQYLKQRLHEGRFGGG